MNSKNLCLLSIILKISILLSYFIINYLFIPYFTFECHQCVECNEIKSYLIALKGTELSKIIAHENMKKFCVYNPWCWP